MTLLSTTINWKCSLIANQGQGLAQMWSYVRQILSLFVNIKQPTWGWLIDVSLSSKIEPFTRVNIFQTRCCVHCSNFHIWRLVEYNCTQNTKSSYYDSLILLPTTVSQASRSSTNFKLGNNILIDGNIKSQVQKIIYYLL